MKYVMTCRRTFIALTSIVLLFVLGVAKDQDVAFAIAGICSALAGANAWESKKKEE